jgi:hypothetical protein
MVEKFFTPKEANLLLPYVKSIVEEILSKAHEARLLLTNPDPSKEHQKQLIDLEERIKILMSRLEDTGCYYKDWSFDIGLVDFPAIIHGQQALLCWRSDEPEVAWFHGFEDGYAGRRRVTRELIFS